MIVNIAGTSGAGKTYLVREFMEWAEGEGVLKPRYLDGRKLPIGYDLILKGERTLHIAGSYEDTPTSGCDTIKDVVWAYDYIREQHDAGKNVLYEGLFMMNMTRGPQLAEEIGSGFHIIWLDVPLAICFAAINERRAKLGQGPLHTKHNTRNNFIRARNYSDAMRGVGAAVIRVNRQQAMSALRAVLGV